VRVIVAGSRGIDDYGAVARAMADSGLDVKVVLSGRARGVDRLGERWAQEHGAAIELYPADWARHGRAAGMIRNAQMVGSADALVALWDGSSRGTGHVIRLAREAGLRVHVSIVNGNQDAQQEGA
jgi:hypothetical protein